MHPLSGDLSVFKDSELESKIQYLTNKYFQTHNMEVRNQMAALLEDYNTELSKRRQEQLKKMMDSRDKSLDKLIKVD
jgi:hypothetical protein